MAETNDEAPRVLQTNIPADGPEPVAIPWGTRVHVTLGDGRIVRSAEHGKQPLPAGGDWITWDVYWQRRLHDGDVVVTELQPDPNAPVEAPAPAPIAAPPVPVLVPPVPAPAPKATKTDGDKPDQKDA